MDLFLIARKIWRYRLLTLPVVILTLVGAVYVVAVKEPLYETSASYLLINPPAPPTEVEVARNPALANVKADNPYTRFGDQSVVIDVLSRTLSSDSARDALVRAGADRRYTVGSGAQFGFSSPIVQIAGTGATPHAAIKTTQVVSHALVGELDRMQRDQDVDREYRIRTQQVVAPLGAQLKASGQLRTLVAVLAAGAILLFVVISVADGVQALRREQLARQAQQLRASDELVVLSQDPELHGVGNRLPSRQEHDRSTL